MANNLYSVRMDKFGKPSLNSFIPIRIWPEMLRGDDGKTVKDASGQPIVKNRYMVVLLGDTPKMYFNRGERKGQFEERLVKPYSRIPLAQGQEKPRLGGRDLTRAVEGTFQKADVDGKELLVLTRRERDDTSIYVQVRTGWYPDAFGRINRSFVQHISDGKTVGVPGSFLFGCEDDTLSSAETEATADEMKNLERSHPLVGGGLAVHHALRRLRPGAFIIGQETNGVLWKLENKGGNNEVDFVYGDDVEDYRADYNEREEERKAEARSVRLAKLARQKQERLSAQENASKAVEEEPVVIEASPDVPSVDSETTAAA